MLRSSPRERALVALAYLVALAAAVFTDLALASWSLLPRLAAADIIATAVVFGFSVRFRNASFYDPYWSVVPLPLALYFAFLAPDSGGLTLRALLVFLLTGAWGARLTWNWLRRWEGLHHQDWRYTNLQEQTGRWYWLVNFLGIHLFPTALVFFGCLPLLDALRADASPFGLLDLLAVAFTAGAIWIEAEADRQLVAFLHTDPAPGTFLEDGLWSWCRHPNYVGEVLFWWGLYFIGRLASPAHAWTILGPLAMTALFFLISVPMIDRRMLTRRPEYARRMRSHYGLLPFGKRN